MKCPYCNQKCSVDSRASFHVFCEQAYDVGHADALAEVALTEEAIVPKRKKLSVNPSKEQGK